MVIFRALVSAKIPNNCSLLSCSLSEPVQICTTFLGCGSVGKEYACNEGDLGSTPGLGRSPGKG